jgi:uncharacterized repeat protein (TIGR04076 family)
MLTGPEADMFKVLTGHSDEAVAKLHPGLEKFFRYSPMLMQHQTIAEVVKSEHCTAQVKVGDKFVFDPFLNPQKSTGVMCPKALLPVLMQINSIWEMAAEWAASGKKDLPEIAFRTQRCLDPGEDVGGIGGVVYRIRME